MGLCDGSRMRRGRLRLGSRRRGLLLAALAACVAVGIAVWLPVGSASATGCRAAAAPGSDGLLEPTSGPLPVGATATFTDRVAAAHVVPLPGKRVHVVFTV